MKFLIAPCLFSVGTADLAGLRIGTAVAQDYLVRAIRIVPSPASADAR